MASMVVGEVEAFLRPLVCCLCDGGDEILLIPCEGVLPHQVEVAIEC